MKLKTKLIMIALAILALLTISGCTNSVGFSYYVSQDSSCQSVTETSRSAMLDITDRVDDWNEMVEKNGKITKYQDDGIQADFGNIRKCHLWYEYEKTVFNKLQIIDGKDYIPIINSTCQVNQECINYVNTQGGDGSPARCMDRVCHYPVDLPSQPGGD